MKKLLNYLLVVVAIVTVALAVVLNKFPKNITTQNQNNNQTPQSIKDAMLQALSQKYQKSADKLTVTTTVDTGLHAKGTVNFVEEGGGGLWLAAKVDDKWQLVTDGQGIVECSTINKYNFPASLIPSCLDSNKNLIQR